MSEFKTIVPALANIEHTPLEEYEIGIKAAQNGMGIKPFVDFSVSEAGGHHSFYKSIQPEAFNGVNTPEDFTIYSKANLKDKNLAEKIFFEYCKTGQPDTVTNRDWATFANLFYPLFTIGKTNANPLAKIANRVGIDDESGFITPNVKFIQGSYEGLDIVKYLPLESWLDESLLDLTDNDYFPIFEESERKMFMLAIGRIIAGVSGESVKHSYRTFTLLKGEPQTGKSSIMNLIMGTLDKLGFKTSNFHKLNTDFGLYDIANSDLAYADDLTTDQLKKILDAPNFKQLISGAKVRCSIKYLPDVEVLAQPAFIANINKFDIGVLYGADDGILNRVSIVSVKTLDDIRNITFPKSSVSFGSPDPRPYTHYRFLAKRLNCSVDAIVISLLRRCYDYFEHCANHEGLESVVSSLKPKLQFRINENVGQSLTSLLQIACELRNPNQGTRQLTPIKLCQAIQATNILVNDLGMFKLSEIIKKDWLSLGRPSIHPWSIISTIDVLSLYSAARQADVIINTPEGLTRMAVAIKTLYGELFLENGFKFGSHVTSIKTDWKASADSETVKRILKAIKSSELYELDTIKATDYAPSFDHLFGLDFDRELIYSKLRSQTK